MLLRKIVSTDDRNDIYRCFRRIPEANYEVCMRVNGVGTSGATKKCFREETSRKGGRKIDFLIKAAITPRTGVVGVLIGLFLCEVCELIAKALYGRTCEIRVHLSKDRHMQKVTE